MNDEQQKEPVGYVTAVLEAFKYALKKYGKHVTAEDMSDFLQVIEDLEKHDKDVASHIFIVNRRHRTLNKRIAEAQMNGNIEDRDDIPWVRQELSMLRWAAKRT